jgi:glycosyltransferase involved in cell wall biosynthesis
VPDAARLGIGVITYNRAAVLRRCVAQIERHTQVPYELVIADDGSTDDTVSWARGAGITTITGPRRGCAWNKNRALYFLAARTGCDVLVLLEDDTWPVAGGWDAVWIAAAQRWHHVNYCYGYSPAGSGTANDPYQGTAFGGHCTITTRTALNEVGYLDTRFTGYGCEHVEWTHRFRARYANQWALPELTVPCLDFGVRASWPESSFSRTEIETNKAVFERIRTDSSEPLHRKPWRNDDERRRLQNEVGQLRPSGPALRVRRLRDERR